MIKYILIVCVFTLTVADVQQSTLLENISKLIKNILETELETSNVSGALNDISEIFKNLRKIEISKFNSSYFKQIESGDVRIRSTAEELINYYGYESEKHIVITVDDYILTLHRITKNKKNPIYERKPAVLLQHGILCSSFDWIISGSNKSLAFMLADLGFDVWLGNSRGNKYSRAHVTMSPDEKEFWDFSWHELGVYDLPAMIDYILKVSGNQKLNYIGYSQGTTMSYVLLSERPEYNSKISKLISLAPVSNGVPYNPLFIFLSLFLKPIEAVFHSLGIYEFNPLTEPLRTFLFHFCNKKSSTFELCKNSIFFAVGRSEELYDADLLPIILQHFPVGSSVKQFEHYRQVTLSGNFRQFDYGKSVNLQYYNSVDPPEYKIENIKVPTTFFVGNHDSVATVKISKKFYNKLGNQNGFYVIPHPEFNHLDFLWAKGVEHLLYDLVISVISNS